MAALLGAVALQVAAGQDVGARLAELRAMTTTDGSRHALAAAEDLAERLDRELGKHSAEAIAAQGTLAHIALNAGEIEDAFAHADTAVARVLESAFAGSPVEAAYRIERGKIAFLLGRVANAGGDFERAFDILDAGSATLRSEALRGIALVFAERGELTPARDRFAKVVSMRRREPGSPGLALALADLASAELRLQRLQASQAAIDEAEQLREGTNRALAAQLLTLRGRLAMARSKLDDADQAFEQAVAFAAGEPLRTGEATLHRGHLALLRGRPAVSLELHQQALTLLRGALERDHPVIGRALVGLALANLELGRPALAAELMRRAIRILENAVGVGTLPVAEARVELAMMLRELDDGEGALVQAEEALAQFERHPAPPPLRLAYALSARGFALEASGRRFEAERSFEQALAEMARISGSDSADLPPGLIRLAMLKVETTGRGPDRRRLAEARDLLDRAWRILEAVDAAGVRLVGNALSAEVRLSLAEGHPQVAWNHARDLLAHMHDDFHGRGWSCADYAERRAVHTAVEAIIEAGTAAGSDAALNEELFAAVQLVNASETTAAVVAAARRRGLEGSAAEAVRRWQDLHDERCGLLAGIVRANGGVGAASAVAPANLRVRVAAIEQELRRLETRGLLPSGELTEGLLRPRIALMAEVQAALSADEGLLIQLTGTRSTHLFWLDQAGLEHRSTQLTRTTLASHVSVLREAVSLPAGRAFADLPPFPVEHAHELYRLVFEPFRHRLSQVRTVLFVPDGPMRSLPPALLIRSPAAAAPEVRDYVGLRQLDWLGRDAAFAIIPAPDALVALRKVRSAVRYSVPFLGVGDPVLGDELPPRDAQPASGVPALSATFDVFRALSPLSGSSEEILAMARALGASPASSVLMGPSATEKRVREHPYLPAARILAFATHGLLAGEFGMHREPALVLSPPVQPLPDDDGLLEASEIAQFSLVAEWVILSACNTASGRDIGASGLSGLARAFFHAGAKSLMVSHWYVPNESARALSNFAIEAHQSADLGRAEALGHAMTRVRQGQHPDGGTRPEHAHPAFWAPFVIVGDPT